MTKKVRASNLELLRLLSMYMIVFIHANMYSGRFCDGMVRVVCNGLINGICNIGVTCFILISGYYGMKFNLKKLIKMECMMITYSLLETFILRVIFPEQMQGGELFESLIKSVFPVISRKYWFYSCYICLYLLSGYIHWFAEKIKKEDFRNFLLILLILFSVFPTLFYFEIIQDNGKGFVQMTMIYLIGRYIKMYHDHSIPKGKAVGIFCGLWLINGISHEIPLQVGGIYHHLCKDNSITNIVMAIILFCLFKELKCQSKMINKLAAGLFAVFALNNSLVQVVMVLPERYGWTGTGGMPGFFVLAGIVFGILLLCIAVGTIRELIFGGTDDKLSCLGERLFQKLVMIWQM